MIRWAVLLMCVTASAQVMKDQPLPPLASSADAVQFLSPDRVAVPAHHAAQVELHFRVADGLHINSHLPLDKFLIPSQFAVVESQGLNVSTVDFPPGEDYTLLKEKLSVYTGEFVLQAHLRAQPGEHELQAVLRYQACDNTTCMPPHSIPVSVTVVAR